MKKKMKSIAKILVLLSTCQITSQAIGSEFSTIYTDDFSYDQGYSFTYERVNENYPITGETCYQIIGVDKKMIVTADAPDGKIVHCIVHKEIWGEKSRDVRWRIKLGFMIEGGTLITAPEFNFTVNYQKTGTFTYGVQYLVQSHVLQFWGS